MGNSLGSWSAKSLAVAGGLKRAPCGLLEGFLRPQSLLSAFILRCEGAWVASFRESRELAKLYLSSEAQLVEMERVLAGAKKEGSFLGIFGFGRKASC